MTISDPAIRGVPLLERTFCDRATTFDVPLCRAAHSHAAVASDRDCGQVGAIDLGQVVSPTNFAARCR